MSHSDNQTPLLSKETRAEICRRNGAKSRGPVTPEGKARSARNAIRHGLLARTVLLKGESEHRFNRLCDRLRREFQPQGPVETGFVETMIVARWRQMRLWALETASVERDTAGSAPAFPGEHPATSVSNAYKKPGLDGLSRHENRLDRQYDRNLRALQQHRKWRQQTQATEE